MEADIARRREHAAHYRALLDGRPGLRLPVPREGVESNGAYFPVVYEGRAARDAACARLEEAGVHPRKYFWPLIPDLDCYAGTPYAARAEVPVARRFAEGVLCRPLYPDRTEEEVEWMAATAARS